jgi:hypothetical protein
VRKRGREKSFSIRYAHSGQIPKENLVRERGLEPPRPFGHKILSLARLPVPPLPHRRYFADYTDVLSQGVSPQVGSIAHLRPYSAQTPESNPVQCH